ncbi:hypothetical protein D3C75_506490 [compost metagenome]
MFFIGSALLLLFFLKKFSKRVFADETLVSTPVRNIVDIILLSRNHGVDSMLTLVMILPIAAVVTFFHSKGLQSFLN